MIINHQISSQYLRETDGFGSSSQALRQVLQLWILAELMIGLLEEISQGESLRNRSCKICQYCSPICNQEHLLWAACTLLFAYRAPGSMNAVVPLAIAT